MSMEASKRKDSHRNLVTPTTHYWREFQTSPSTMPTQTTTSNCTLVCESVTETIATQDFYIGLTLAVCSSAFIGSSFVIKKQALIKISTHSLRAGDGGHAYLREWLWWAGFLLLGFGEVCNFLAYAFAPATLVTPLGALSVIVSAVLSSYCLNESLNLLGKVGCLLCILGAIVIVIHTPVDEAYHTLHWLTRRLRAPAFVVYVCLVAAASLVLAFAIAPRWGHTNVLVYVLICSIIGSLTVMACKGVGIALVQLFEGVNTLAVPVTWILLLLMGVFITVQMHYLNKSLDIFNTAVVTPIYYVFFTASVLVASSILFEDWRVMSAEDIIGVLDGFGVIISGIFLLHAFRELPLTLSDLPTGDKTTSGNISVGTISRPTSESEEHFVTTESVGLLNDIGLDIEPYKDGADST
ncbi:magnesium transporter NIPA2-like [Diadema antillarum]|uniref:magnesium transporter NIPA2-like n=1 Tax=Diadema antillarum TaxID=105358 RepID=UPI003A8435B6